MPSVILTTQPASTLSVVPKQNTTFTVVASADFPVTGYTYQWKKAAAGGAIGSATNISGATNNSYFFEPASGDNGFKYYCTVNALSATSSGPASQASVNSTGIALTVAADATTFARWTPKSNDPNPLNESGPERFRRMRNLGYC
jgi:hypothetical protein